MSDPRSKGGPEFRRRKPFWKRPLALGPRPRPRTRTKDQGTNRCCPSPKNSQKWPALGGNPPGNWENQFPGELHPPYAPIKFNGLEPIPLPKFLKSKPKNHLEPALSLGPKIVESSFPGLNLNKKPKRYLDLYRIVPQSKSVLRSKEPVLTEGGPASWLCTVLYSPLQDCTAVCTLNCTAVCTLN